MSLTRTPLKGLTVGSVVRVIGYEGDGDRTVVELMDQELYAGGVRLDRPVAGLLKYWNEDDLEPWSPGGLRSSYVHHNSQLKPPRVGELDGSFTDDWAKVTCPSCLQQNRPRDDNYLHHYNHAPKHIKVRGAVTDDWAQVTCPTCIREGQNNRLQEKTKAMSIPFTLTNENITIILDGKPVVVHAGTPQFTGLRDALFREDWAAVPKLASRMGAIQQWLGDKFVVNGDEISYEGVPLPASLVRRIDAMATAFEDPSPLFRFYERLHKNPSYRSRTQLFDFMQHTGIPIEPDGTFLAYKGVKHDYTDGHTGKVDNSPGAHNSMPRHLISDDPEVACHFGFHVGALGYAGTFSQRVVICRVNPEHVVCVPRDYSAQKMRVCDYTVIGNHVGAEMPSTTYAPDVDEGDDEEWGGEVEGEDQDAVENPDHNPDDTNEHRKPAVLVTKKPKPTGPKASAFNRMKPGTLMEQGIDDLRKYASAHLKIVGASKMPGGKSALVSKILKVRRRRRS